MSERYSGVLDPEADDLAVAKDISTKFKQSTDGNLTSITKTRKYWQYFNGIPPKKAAHHGEAYPNLFVPHTETIVDTIVSKFFMSLFAQDPIIRYEPMDSEGSLASKIVERLIHYQLMHKIPDALTNMFLWVQDAVVQGYGMLHVYWDKETHTKRRLEIATDPTGGPLFEIDEDGNPKVDETGQFVPVIVPVIETVTDYEGFKFQVLDIENIAVDWDTLDFRQSWAVIREYIEPELYNQRVKHAGYEPLSQDDLEKALVSINYRVRDLNEHKVGNVVIPGSGSSIRTDESRKKIELLHYYGKGYLDDSPELQNVKFTVIKNLQNTESNTLLVKKADFSMKPLAMLRYKPEKNNSAGRGVCDQTYDLQTEANLSKNAELLNMYFSINKGWIIGADAGLRSNDDLISQPNMLVHVEDINAIREISHTPLSSDTFRNQQDIKGMMEDVTGALEIVQGQASRQELATTASLLNSNAMKRLELTIYRMAKEGLSQLGNILQNLMVEMYNPDDEVTARLTKDEIDMYGDSFPDNIQGEEFLTAQIQDIDKAMFATTEISATEGNNRTQAQELLQLLQTIFSMAPQGFPAKVDPATGQPSTFKTINAEKIIGELFRLQGTHNIKDYFIEVPIPQPEEGQEGSPKSVRQEVPGAEVPPPQSELDNRVTEIDESLS